MRLKDAAKRWLLNVGLDVRFSARYDARAVQRRLLAGTTVSTVVDAGAHHGEWTAFYRTAFPSADVYAFEPFPASAAVFSDRHRADTRVRLVQTALAEAVGTRQFHVTTNPQHNSLLPADPAAATTGAAAADHEVGTLEVGVTSLDEFCRERGLTKIDVLKMDLQGGELHALQGGEGLLRAGAVSVIYTEVLTVPLYTGQCYFHEVAAALYDFGYRLFGMYNPDLSPAGQTTSADAIFISPAVQRRIAPSASG